MNCVKDCGDFLLKMYATLIIKRSVKDNYDVLIKIQKKSGTNGQSDRI